MSFSVSSASFWKKLWCRTTDICFSSPVSMLFLLNILYTAARVQFSLQANQLTVLSCRVSSSLMSSPMHIMIVSVFFCVCVLGYCCMCYSRSTTVAALLSIPLMVIPTGAPMYVGSHTTKRCSPMFMMSPFTVSSVNSTAAAKCPG